MHSLLVWSLFLVCMHLWLSTVTFSAHLFLQKSTLAVYSSRFSSAPDRRWLLCQPGPSVCGQSRPAVVQTCGGILWTDFNSSSGGSWFVTTAVGNPKKGTDCQRGRSRDALLQSLMLLDTWSRIFDSLMLRIFIKHCVQAGVVKTL